MIKKPTRLDLPTYLDDEFRHNESYANQCRNKVDPWSSCHDSYVTFFLVYVY